jgi:hypothetical protein
MKSFTNGLSSRVDSLDEVIDREMQDLRSAPLRSQRANRRRYNTTISSAHRCARARLLTNAALVEAIRAAQRELLRPQVEH